ncbi:MAG: LuxR C-terminal-related transcriptional regulator [Asticcacaulis sp.]
MGWAVDEKALARTADAFHAAALGGTSWDTALNGFAEAAGSRSGQLIGLGDRAVMFNHVTNCEPGHVEEFAQVGGGDPRVNSRVRIGIAAPELSACDERQFSTAEDALRFPDYGAYLERHDMPFICLTPLVKLDDLLVGTAVIRRAKEGPITTPQLDVFNALTPHLRAAVRTQMALEGQGIALLANAMDAIEACVYVCDRKGRVRAMSHRAEALVLEGRWLQICRGRLSGHHLRETIRLHNAISLAVQARNLECQPPRQAFVMRDMQGFCLPLEVTPLPEQHAFAFSASALLIAYPQRDKILHAIEMSRLLFDLTPAEASVAGMLAGGMGPQAIAGRAGTSVATVRVHLRRIYDKTGCRSQVELVAALMSRL